MKNPLRPKQNKQAFKDRFISDVEAVCAKFMTPSRLINDLKSY